MTRRRDETDGRQYRIELTRSGTDAIVRDVGHWDEWLLGRMVTEPNETEREVLRLAAALMDRLAGED